MKTLLLILLVLMGGQPQPPPATCGYCGHPIADEMELRACARCGRSNVPRPDEVAERRRITIENARQIAMAVEGIGVIDEYTPFESIDYVAGVVLAFCNRKLATTDGWGGRFDYAGLGQEGYAIASPGPNGRLELTAEGYFNLFGKQVCEEEKPRTVEMPPGCDDYVVVCSSLIEPGGKVFPPGQWPRE